MLMPLSKIIQECGVKKGVIEGCLRFLVRYSDDMVIPVVMYDLLLTEGRHPESFGLIS